MPFCRRGAQPEVGLPSPWLAGRPQSWALCGGGTAGVAAGVMTLHQRAKRRGAGVKSLSHPDYPRRLFLRGLRGGKRGGPPHCGYSSSASNHCTSGGRKSGVRMPEASRLSDLRRYLTVTKPAVSSWALTLPLAVEGRGCRA